MNKVSTPCIKVCIMEYGICKGCKRTNKEIKEWIKYSEEQRKEIMENLDGRN